MSADTIAERVFWVCIYARPIGCIEYANIYKANLMC